MIAALPQNFRHAASFCLAILICSAVTTAAAQTHGKRASGNLQDTVYNLEHQLAGAEKQHNKKFFAASMDKDLVYVAYNGLVFNKDRFLATLRYIDVNHYSMENFKTRSLGPDAALVTYDLRIKAEIAGSQLPHKQYASSVWVRNSGGWQLIFSSGNARRAPLGRFGIHCHRWPFLRSA